MKTLSFAVAMLAAASMVVTPVAPSFAQGLDDSRYAPKVQTQAVTAKASRQKIAAHAERGEAAILSKAQMDRLAKSDPKLHARLMAAYNSGTVPALTPKEKKMLVAITQANLETYKAGSPHVAGAAVLVGGAWFAVGFLALVALLIFLYWVAPAIFRPRTV